MCAFSKWLECVVLNSTTSKAVWDAFESNIIYRFRAPIIVVSDGGLEFKANFDLSLR